MKLKSISRYHDIDYPRSVLDGDFTIEELKLIVKKMEKLKKEEETWSKSKG